MARPLPQGGQSAYADLAEQFQPAPGGAYAQLVEQFDPVPVSEDGDHEAPGHFRRGISPSSHVASDDETSIGTARDHHGQSSWIKDKFPYVDVDSDQFGICVGIVILFNAIVIGLETDCGRENFVIFEHMLTIFFFCEMCLRMYSYGCKGYFCDAWNLFDFTLVTLGICDLYILPHLAGAGQAGPAVSLLRMARMLRVLRILRLFRMFHNLMVIMAAFVKAFSSVLWIGLLIVILDYVLAVFLTQMVGKHAERWGSKEEDILLWFGNVGRSMNTLFIVMSLCTWTDQADTLMEVYPSLIVFPLFVLYIVIASYTMVSLVTGVISESLITAQRQDEEIRVATLKQEKVEFQDRVTYLLHSMDDEGDQYLEPDEVLQASKSKDLFDHLEIMEINLDEDGLRKLMERLAEADPSGPPGACRISDLAEALLHHSGPAKAKGIADVKHLITEVQDKLGDEHKQLLSEIRGLHARLDARGVPK